MAITNQQQQQSTLSQGATQYDVYAAATGDPRVNAISKAVASKVGGGEFLIRDLIMALQAGAGVENSGVAAAQSLRAGVMRGGIQGIMPNGQVGMINGMDVASQQAAQAMQQQMMKAFTNQVTGAPNYRAHGLDMGELGRLGGYMMSQGAGLVNGPMYRSELLDQQRIDQLRNEAQNMQPGAGRAEAMAQARGLKVGQLHMTGTSNLNQFNSMLEDGADTLKAIKDVFGAGALKDLDATFQELLGGSLQEIGPRAARARMMGIKSMGTTFFGGDMQAAGIYSLGNQRGLAAAIGAGMNIDPQTAEGMFGKLTSSISYALGVSGFTGQNNQTALAATAAKYGVGMSSKGAAEISAINKSDLGRVANENTEAAALVALQQRTGATMSVDHKKEITERLAEMGSAKTSQDQQAAREKMEMLFQRLTGTSTGADIANRGGLATVISGLGGAASAQLMEANWADLQQRNQNMARVNLRRDYNTTESLRNQGMNADEYVEFGITAANLSNQQSFAIQKALEETDPAKRREALDKVKGLKTEFRERLMQQKDGGLLAQIQASIPQHAGMGNFMSTGEQEATTTRVYQDWLSKNQYSDASNTDDFATGLIRGMLGGKPITGKDVLEKAAKLKLPLTELSMKDGSVEATLANAKGVRDALGADGMAAEGLTDIESVRKYLESPDSFQKLTEHFGTWGVKGNSASVLSKADAEKGKIALEDQVRNDLLSKTGSSDPKFARKEGESDEDYAERYSQVLGIQVRKMATTSSNGDANNAWSQMDDLLNKVAAGDPTAETTYKALVEGGGFSGNAAHQARQESAKKLLRLTEQQRKEGKGDGLKGDEFSKYVDEKQAKLEKLRDSLLSQEKTMNAQTVTIHTNSVTTNQQEKG